MTPPATHFPDLWYSPQIPIWKTPAFLHLPGLRLGQLVVTPESITFLSDQAQPEDDAVLRDILTGLERTRAIGAELNPKAADLPVRLVFQPKPRPALPIHLFHPNPHKGNKPQQGFTPGAFGAFIPHTSTGRGVMLVELFSGIGMAWHQHKGIIPHFRLYPEIQSSPDILRCTIGNLIEAAAMFFPPGHRTILELARKAGLDDPADLWLQNTSS